ncbi:GIY-YIG nuclease family protein [Aquabacterium sp. A7-Y]|uniref:GIY-YIG nuclease family protein n=1 Tax=Aquabacterium sp. A7-Y TaxID=1349605 RepID=UPI0039FD40BE
MLEQGGFTFEQIAEQLGVSLNVVLGVNSHYQRGRYNTKPKRSSASTSGRTVRRDRGWTYLLVSRCGIVYVGATTDLRQRFRSHNSPTNKGWTRGRHWHLLGAVRFDSRSDAFDQEALLKRSGKARGEWIEKCLPRANRLAERWRLPPEWLRSLTSRAHSLQR